MQAVVITPEAPGRLALAEVQAPTPAPSEALVRVAAVSLNRGEVTVAGEAPAGLRFGNDFAGIVEHAAADGSGPPAGARVVGILNQAAWAEFVAAPTDALVQLFDTVSFAQAAALPVAGLTACYTLARRAPLIGRRVLVTGASGGVGLFACQLARLAGASRVVGVVRSAEHATAVREAGAHEVVTGGDTLPAEPFGPYDLILESVGGASLASALTLLKRDGICVCYGWSSGAQSTIDLPRLVLSGGSMLQGFFLFNELERLPARDGLTHLVELVAAGILRVSIGAEAHWGETGAVAQRLLARDFTGKAVLHVEPPAARAAGN